MVSGRTQKTLIRRSMADLFCRMPGDALDILGVLHKDTHALKVVIGVYCTRRKLLRHDICASYYAHLPRPILSYPCCNSPANSRPPNTRCFCTRFHGLPAGSYIPTQHLHQKHLRSRCLPPAPRCRCLSQTTLWQEFCPTGTKRSPAQSLHVRWGWSCCVRILVCYPLNLPQLTATDNDTFALSCPLSTKQGLVVLDSTLHARRDRRGLLHPEHIMRSLLLYNRPLSCATS